MSDSSHPDSWLCSSVGTSAWLKPRRPLVRSQPESLSVSYPRHRFRVVKTCTGCKIEKVLAEFAWKDERKGRRSARCRACHAQARRDHYERNRQKYIDKARAWRDACRDKNRERVLTYLAEHPCVDCGEPDPMVLDFDHREDKSFGIADMMQFAQWTRIQAEIAKCDVRCANCHRRKTARERGYWRSIAVHAH